MRFSAWDRTAAPGFVDPTPPNVYADRMSDTAAPSTPGKRAARPASAKAPAPPLRQVVFHTYPKLIFAWPVIAAGVLLWPVVSQWNGDPEVFGWVYAGVLCLTLLTLGIDLERDHAVFWGVVFLAFFFLGKWLDARFDGFTLLGDAYRLLADLDVDYRPSFGLAVSLLLLPPYLVMLVYARLQHRWRITHNEFEHYSWGRADDSLARGAKRVRSTYPDLLELLLCGAGTLVVYSATGRTELRRIPHVPLIFRVRKKINRLLEATAVVQETSDVALDDELDDEAADEPERPTAPAVRPGSEPL